MLTASNLRPSLIDVTAMREAATEAVTLLRALAHPDRLLLLCELSHGDRGVSELAERLDMRQPTLSQQLGVLRAERLVRVRRDGKRVIYGIAASQALAVITALQDVYCPREAPKPTRKRQGKA